MSTGAALSTRRASRADATFGWVVRGTGITVLAVLALMIATTTFHAWPVFQHEGLRFFTGTSWNPGTSRTAVTGTYGALPFIYGTIVTSVLALLIGVPLSVGVALSVTEVVPRRLRRPLSYAVDLLAAVPSVVYGLWGVLFFVPYVLLPVMNKVAATLGKAVPVFAPPVTSVNYFAAGVVLAIMIIPIVAAISREVFTAVPDGERQGAYALGATRWEVITRVVLPRAKSGIVGASMLGLGRALGETIAVALLIGGSPKIDVGLFHPGYSIASLIANTFQEAAPEAVRALVAIGVTLFGITIIVNVIARLIVWRFGEMTTGEAQ